MARLGLFLALLVLRRLNDHALLVPDELAAGEQLEPAGVLRVPVALDALERDATTRARRGRRARLGRRARGLFCPGHRE
jgi:hypothetical protein